ncbi:MAG TPA: GAF domain-containing sensor histidine kinase [Anaeromyxobacteraceae bacterium]|nr:GAF domain-containing sensor histidine kinase [Anaeromyxobacteraceae bacterium]
MSQHPTPDPPSTPEAGVSAEYVTHLQRFTAAVSSAVRMTDVARVLSEQGLERFGAKAVGIVWMMRPRAFELVFGHGVTEAEFAMLDAAARAGERLPIRDAIVSRRSVWLDTPEQIRERYPAVEALRARRGESGFAVVPLVVGDRCPGVIGFTFDRPGPFSEAERGFIETLARVSAQAFERARLFEAEQAARMEAERIGKLQQQLMAVVGHDLRTPLSAIMVSSEFLGRRGGLTADQSTLLARITASASRMSVIIRDLVDFGRVRQGLGVAIQKQSADVADVVRAAILELHEDDQGRIALDVDGDTRIECDAGRILQVASNLLANALRHSGGGTVRVEVAGATDEVVLSVHNDGPKIDPELLPHVFEPFRQGDDPDVHVGSSGLGLFIVREIVSAHLGAVDVTSTATEGTTFAVHLPRRERAAARP